MRGDVARGRMGRQAGSRSRQRGDECGVVRAGDARRRGGKRPATRGEARDPAQRRRKWARRQRERREHGGARTMTAEQKRKMDEGPRARARTRASGLSRCRSIPGPVSPATCRHRALGPLALAEGWVLAAQGGSPRPDSEGRRPAAGAERAAKPAQGQKVRRPGDCGKRLVESRKHPFNQWSESVHSASLP